MSASGHRCGRCACTRAIAWRRTSPAPRWFFPQGLESLREPADRNLLMRRVPLLLCVGALLVAAAPAHAFSVEPSPAATPTPLKPKRGSAADRERYARNDRAHVSRADVKRFLPIYGRASRRYDVPWLLLASIQKQETAFSPADGTYHGLNWVHCCAGPMQFNVTNKPVSTWKRFRHAHLDAPRFDDYPHPTRKHPSVYDDFDAIMAAAKLLKTNGATTELDITAWRAAYLYYGPGDLSESDFGLTYANEVLARAINWARRGFNPDAATPRGLVSAVAGLYQPAPPKKKHHKHKKKRKHKHKKSDKAKDDAARKVRERELRARQRRRSAERKARDRRADKGRPKKDPHVRPDQPSQQPSGGAPQPQGSPQGGSGSDPGGQPGGVGPGDGCVLPTGCPGPPVHGAAPSQGSGTAPAGDPAAADPGGSPQPGAAGAGTPAG